MKKIFCSIILMTSSSLAMAIDWSLMDEILSRNPTEPMPLFVPVGDPSIDPGFNLTPHPLPPYDLDIDMVFEPDAFNEHDISDLELIAESNGWTLEQAKKHRRSINRVERHARILANTHPRVFIGAVAPDEWNGNPVLYFKGEVDSALLMTLTAADIDVIDRQPYSLRELKQKQQGVYSHFADQGYEQIVTSFDIRDGVIEAIVTRTAGAISPSPLALDGVNITYQDEPVLVNHAAYGGMTAKVNGTPSCTTGWPVNWVIWGNITRQGISTAGHCSGINQISHSGETHPVYLMREHRGYWGDMEWLLSIEPVTANFYASENQIRPVRSIEPVDNIIVGEPICVYGRFSNVRNCSLRVQYTSVSCGGLSNLVLMNGLASTFGDSGGGWSFGTRAYGSNVGSCGGRSIFTPVDLFDEGMGVRVLTQ